MASAAGNAETFAARSSVWPALPDSVTEPPPISSANFSMLVVPLAMVRAEASAIAALMPRTVASPEAISTLVTPPAILTRPAAVAGMPAIVAPPVKLSGL